MASSDGGSEAIDKPPTVDQGAREDSDGNAGRVVDTKSDSGETKNEAFPLLDLPPELWIRICRFAVFGEITLYGSHTRSEVQHLVEQPPITRVCQTIRHETLATFYNNQFLYEDEADNLAKPFLAWLKHSWSARSLKQRKLLHLAIESHCEDVEDQFEEKLKRRGWQMRPEDMPTPKKRRYDFTEEEVDVRRFRITPLEETELNEGGELGAVEGDVVKVVE